VELVRTKYADFGPTLTVTSRNAPKRNLCDCWSAIEIAFQFGELERGRGIEPLSLLIGDDHSVARLQPLDRGSCVPPRTPQ
jgi:hypothetical protein